MQTFWSKKLLFIHNTKKERTWLRILWLYSFNPQFSVNSTPQEKNKHKKLPTSSWKEEVKWNISSSVKKLEVTTKYVSELYCRRHAGTYYSHESKGFNKTISIFASKISCRSSFMFVYKKFKVKIKSLYKNWITFLIWCLFPSITFLQSL